MWKELTTHFDRQQFANTKNELTTLREDRALRLFGS
jgi:hypothetical protein